MNLVDVVENSLKTAQSGVSVLPKSVIEIKGHGTNIVSTFFNTICGWIPDCRYLEFGTFAGRSLAAAGYGNDGNYRGVD